MGMDNINMSEEQYKALYNRIKTDLYNEFINPETATYGADVLRQQETNDDIYKDIVTEKEMIWNEIDQLTIVMQKYEDDEEYEHAAFMKKRIENLKKRL
jgi:excinuclease UvrABC helicase subunit UvrB